MKKLLIVLVLIAVAGAAAWIFLKPGPNEGNGPGQRKVAFYQSPMHPWIKSETPGNCTICGMKLTPIMEGEKGFDMDPNFIPLSSNSISVVNVQTEAAAIRPVEKTIRTSGRIEADETQYRIISAYVDGRVEKLYVNYVGAEISAGEPLAEIFSPALLTAEREYLSLLGRAGTNLNLLNEETGSLIAGARERLRRLGLNATQIEALGQKQETNDTTQVTAPISGTVIKRSVFEGQYVKEGDPLFEIANLDTMWFKFDLFEQDLPLVTTGTQVQVTTAALPGQVFEGEITFIDPTLNEMTRSARARVELKNRINQVLQPPRRVLMNGMLADARVIMRTEPVLSVPRTAVLQASSEALLFIEGEGNIYERRKVRLGRKGDSYYEILSGVEPGEKVVTSGNLLLDSQSQLNPTAHTHEHAPKETTAAPQFQPNESQIQAVGELFTFASQLSQSLANDNLSEFQARLKNGEPRLPAWRETFGSLAAGATNMFQQMQRVASGMRGDFADLEEARALFEPWSRAVVDFAREWRKVRPNETVKLYRCPMYPTPGKSGFWVQLEAPLRNPYFGAEMLDCGTEIP